MGEWVVRVDAINRSTILQFTNELFLPFYEATVLARIWRAWLRLRFLLFQRHRFNRLVLERVGDYSLLILPDVFNPTLFLTSEFMVEAFDSSLIPPGSSVLDMGTGSGIGAIFAARWAGRVLAVDVNPAAVRCARINVLLNDLEAKIVVREGDLFAGLAERRFAVILFNPPYFPGEPTGALDRAFHATDVAERFAAGLGAHLVPGGWALVLLSSLGDEAGFLAALAARGWAAKGVAQRRLPSERITLYRVARA